MIVKELKEILKNFEDDKDVIIFLELTPNYGFMYEIEDWVNNKRHLNLGISDSVDNSTSELESIKK
jgi:hypothetical protein